MKKVICAPSHTVPWVGDVLLGGGAEPRVDGRVNELCELPPVRDTALPNAGAYRI